MKKILKGLAKYVAFTILLACFLPLSLQHVQADEDEVEYSLPSYVGHLSIHDDGNATFTQEVTYDFDSDYKGQYVTLGKIGGYSIMDDPKVSATVNGKEKTDITVEKTDSYDGIKLKVYNSGSDGDRVVLKVTWQIQQLLNLYSDIAVLNWFPISDWDKGFGQVDFLEMLFDDRIEITDREMFSRYYLDEKGLRKQFNNAKSNYERDSVREEGQRIRRKFVKDGRSVTEGVNREISSLGLPNLY